MDNPILYSTQSSMQTTDNIHVIYKYFNLMQWENQDSLVVLDVGCGEGRITADILLPKLPPAVSKVIGCDLSEKMVQFAKERYSSTKLDFCKLDIGDSSACQSLSSHFDRIFSFYCFHWIPDQRRAFQNLFTLLKPGGEILLSFLGTCPIFEVYLNISKNIRWAPYFKEEMISPYHNNLDPQRAVERILSDTGFSNWKCIVENRRYVFPSMKKVQDAVTGVNPILPKLHPQDQAQYLQDFMKEVSNVYKTKLQWGDNNNNNVPVPVDYQLIVVHATKPAS